MKNSQPIFTSSGAGPVKGSASQLLTLFDNLLGLVGEKLYPSWRQGPGGLQVTDHFIHNHWSKGSIWTCSLAWHANAYRSTFHIRPSSSTPVDECSVCFHGGNYVKFLTFLHWWDFSLQFMIDSHIMSCQCLIISEGSIISPGMWWQSGSDKEKTLEGARTSCSAQRIIQGVVICVSSGVGVQVRTPQLWFCTRCLISLSLCVLVSLSIKWGWKVPTPWDYREH